MTIRRVDYSRVHVLFYMHNHPTKLGETIIAYKKQPTPKYN